MVCANIILKILDFESLLVKVNDGERHIPSGFAYQVVSRFPEYHQPIPVCYRGPNAARTFIKSIQQEYEKVRKFLWEPPGENIGGLSSISVYNEALVITNFRR